VNLIIEANDRILNLEWRSALGSTLASLSDKFWLAIGNAFPSHTRTLYYNTFYRHNYFCIKISQSIFQAGQNLTWVEPHTRLNSKLAYICGQGQSLLQWIPFWDSALRIVIWVWLQTFDKGGSDWRYQKLWLTMIHKKYDSTGLCVSTQQPIFAHLFLLISGWNQTHNLLIIPFEYPNNFLSQVQNYLT
jgi:hypothetical protein